MNCAHCLHIVLAIEKYKDVFGVGEFLVGVFTRRNVSKEEFLWWKEIFHGRGAVFPSIM